MFNRIIYHLRKQTGHTVILIVIYTVIILFFCSTLLITNIADLFNDTFADNLNIYVSMDHPLERNVDTDYDTGQYLNESTEIFNDYQNISETAGVEWSCLTEVMGDHSFMIPGYLDDNQVLHVASTQPGDHAPVTKWTTEYNFNYLLVSRIYGTTSSQMPELRFNKAEVKEGRTFTQEELDQGAAVCVLYNRSFLIHDEDGQSVKDQMINVGDTIPISIFQIDENGTVNCLYSKNLKVIGYCETNPSELSISPRIYIPMNTFRSLEDEYLNMISPEDIHRTYYSSAALFKVDTIEHLNNLVQKIEETDGYQRGFLSYYSTTDNYASLIADVYTTTQGFRIISYACFVLAIVMSIALTMILMRYRRRENMILYSMGEKKKTLVLQNVVENGLLMIPALLIGIPGSLKLSRKFTESMFETQNVSLNEGVNSALKNSGIETTEIKPSAEAIRQYISMSGKQWMALIILVIAVLIVTGIISWLNEKKMHVRDLLN